jgi:hypothetical protein
VRGTTLFNAPPYLPWSSDSSDVRNPGGSLLLLASTAGDSSPTAIGSGFPSSGGVSEPAIPGPDTFAFGGPPPPALPDRTETAWVVLRFLRSGTEVLGGTDGALVCPQVKGEIYQLGMALAVWAAPDASFSGEGVPGPQGWAPRLYPAPFDSASAEAGQWTTGLRARAVASNIAVATYEATTSPLPDLIWREHQRIKAAIRSHTKMIRRRLRREAGDIPGPSTRRGTRRGQQTAV